MVFRIGYVTKVVFLITLLILANLAPRRALNRLSVRNTYLLFFIFERGDCVVLSKGYFFFVCQISRFLKASSQTFVNARHFSEQSWIVSYNRDNRPNTQPAISVLAGYPTTSPHPQGKAPWGRGWLSTRRVSPFLDLSLVGSDFHARSRFARSTIPEEK